MRVAIMINKLVSAGAERLIVDEIAEFKSRGISVDLITLAPERAADSFMSLVELPENSKHMIVFRSLTDTRSWLALVRLLRREKPDVLFTHLWFANTIGRVAGAFAGVRTVPFEHNVYDQIKSRKQFLVDRALQYFSYKIIAVSEAVRDSLVRHGIEQKRIAVVENGINLSRYRDARPADVSKQAFTFLFVGRLVRQKAVDVLLDALAALSEVNLWIVGEGNERSALEDQASKLGIAERVFFLGIRNDVSSLMRTADCFVLPSRYEGFGMVLIEAMAAGLPCVVSDFSAAQELLRDGVSGLIVPRDDPRALTTAMRGIAQQPKYAASLAEAATHDVERFSIARHVSKLLNVLEKAPLPASTGP
jgi:glycosyltransferase involved in cell wall biosynthesis